jgi:3-hydroxyisobutyrate dehydrogenase
VTPLTVGFIGLGNMGSALAANLVGAGNQVLAHDVSGPQRTPEGANYLPSAAAVASAADVVVLSLPDGAASELVASQLLTAPDRRVTHVVDTSTVGVSAARTICALLAGSGVRYVDAPVSGGVSGAQARTLAVMCACPPDAFEYVQAVLEGLSDRIYRVSDQPGAAQALKLANNFLSATALAATSEAVAFGLAAGLDMGTMLSVLNVSSGRSAATSDKFPDHVLTGRYSSGFANSLMSKDLRLYLEAVVEAGAPSRIGMVTADLWDGFAKDQPGADFTRIFPFVNGR